MPFLTESDIEHYALELLEAQGYRCLYGPDIAPIWIKRAALSWITWGSLLI